MKYTTLLFLFTFSLKSLAQDEADALRFSMHDIYGSGRAQGMGGAFGALGADLSSFFNNPAGLGVYKMNSLTVGFGVNDAETATMYRNNSKEDSRETFNFNHGGFVSTREKKQSKWVTTSFGIAYMRMRNFNEDFSVAGTNENTTFLDVLAQQAAGVSPELLYDQLPFTSALAYETYTIDPSDSLGTSYIPVVTGGKVNQEKIVYRDGNSAETAFSYGGSYLDKIFIGASVGFTSINYSEKGKYTENGFENTDLNTYTFYDEVETGGFGVNLKLGIIGKISPWLQLGAAYHTPSYIGLSDTYSTGMYSTFNNTDSYDMTSPIGEFTYNLRTPSRYIANAAIVMGDFGVIAVDYEFADYGNMHMKTPKNSESPYSFETENQTIENIYRGVHRVNAGFELRLLTYFRLRGGAVYETSPFSFDSDYIDPSVTFTAGAGYKGRRFFADFALTHHVHDEIYYLYNPSMVEPATIQQENVEVSLSIGMRY